MKRLLTLLTCLSLSLALCGAEWFVSPDTGKKKNPGTKEEPLKSVADAIKKAEAGDTIYLAAGLYTGAMGASEIVVDKPLVLMGGYTADFSSRDVIANPSIIQPKNEKNDTARKAIINLQLPPGNPELTTVIDGLVIDEGQMHSYHKVKGKPEGVETGMWLKPPAKDKDDKFSSATCYGIYSESKLRYEGKLVIRNCVFANTGDTAVVVSKWLGDVEIKNNLFVACRQTACDVTCSNPNKMVECDFENNTVLFTWSSTDDFGSMGYGYRTQPNVKAEIKNNIFGLNITAGVNHAKGDAKKKAVAMDENVFFLNRKGDIDLQGGGAVLLSLKVADDEFEELEDAAGMESVEDNISLNDPGAFKGRINEAYLNGFLNASYSETTDYDENSPANTFRAAMGMNKVGKIETKVSMYANRYPLEECYKLFGALEGYGAQLPQ
ncbi:MAG: right-handed parallel beta-helix repeat-containing protein [Oligosphaeraceae bacterium]